MELRIDSDYFISDEKSLLDLKVIHDFLTNSYWSKGIPVELVKKAIDNSFCAGVYFKNTQIGFARVVTDFTLTALLGDVFILENHRGKGLSKQMMNFLIGHPKLKSIRTWRLATNDAHGLYSQFGFHVIENPENFMERKIKVG